MLINAEPPDRPAIVFFVPDRRRAKEARRGRVWRLLRAARRQIGVRYAWGGTEPHAGFDCSGLVRWLYRVIGVLLPRTTWAQMNIGRAVSINRIEPGDIVFTNGGRHVSMYMGEGMLVTAPQSGERVKYRTLESVRSGIVAIRRVLRRP